MMITSNLFFSCQFSTNQWPSHHQKPCKKLGDVMGPYLDSWIRGKKKSSTKTKLCPNFCCGRDHQTGPIFFGGIKQYACMVIWGISLIIMAFFGLVVRPHDPCVGWTGLWSYKTRSNMSRENFQVCNWIVEIWTSFGQIDLFGSWINTILPLLANHTGGNKILAVPTTSSCCEGYAGSSWRIGFILVKVKERYFPPRFKSTNSWTKVVHCWCLVMNYFV